MPTPIKIIATTKYDRHPVVAAFVLSDARNVIVSPRRSMPRRVLYPAQFLAMSELNESMRESARGALLVIDAQARYYRDKAYHMITTADVSKLIAHARSLFGDLLAEIVVICDHEHAHCFKEAPSS